MAVLFGLVFFARVTSDAGASADGYYTTETPDEDNTDDADGDGKARG
ncbi:hypothetical protein [Pararhizobium polonicum]|nr:hypothetical protein [Pararhizobium polonicum]